MKTVKVRPGQTVFDVAIQEYGTTDGALWLAQDNNLEGWQVNEGTVLRLRDEVINKQVADWHKSKEHYPASETLVPSGQDYNEDFNTDYLA